jgi:hypothetical protein
MAGIEQHLVGHDDQCITRQQGQRLAKFLVHGGPTAPRVGVVKGRHVVVHQRGAMHQFDGTGCRVGEFGQVVATGHRHCHHELRANARTTGKHRMAHRRHQARWRRLAYRSVKALQQRFF